ncbi:uncharacterized protein ACH125_004134 isoform 1-T1 [Urocitellus parryii]
MLGSWVKRFFVEQNRSGELKPRWDPGVGMRGDAERQSHFSPTPIYMMPQSGWAQNHESLKQEQTLFLNSATCEPRKPFQEGHTPTGTPSTGTSPTNQCELSRNPRENSRVAGNRENLPPGQTTWDPSLLGAALLLCLTKERNSVTLLKGKKNT